MIGVLLAFRLEILKLLDLLGQVSGVLDLVLLEEVKLSLSLDCVLFLVTQLNLQMLELLQLKLDELCSFSLVISQSLEYFILECIDTVNLILNIGPQI